jgi:RNA polymerase sigma-70 factor (ECF subfamily)
LASADDTRLVRRLKARSPGAFEALIERYQGPIFNLVYRMLGNRAEAEDLAQEVFITVFKQIDGFRGEASLSTWLYRIASNHCINRRKYLSHRRHWDGKSLSDLGDREELGTGRLPAGTRPPRPDEMAEGLELERAIQAAISSLEEDHRLVLVLRDVQGLSYEEIVEITGVAIGTVKSRLHRARMALKEKLDTHLAR